MFYLKDKDKEFSRIVCYLRKWGRKYKIYINEEVETDKWISEKHRCITGRNYKDGMAINSRLEKWQEIINSAFNYFATNFIVPTQKEFKDKIEEFAFGENQSNDTFISYVENRMKTMEVASSTMKKYGTMVYHLKKFEKQIGSKLTFKDIDIHFYRSFERYFNKQQLSKNHFGSIIKNIKKFMNDSFADGLHSYTGHKHKDFITAVEESDSIYLSEQELLKIHNLDIDNLEVNVEHNISRHRKALKIARDRFLIGAFTALRVSDFNRLDEINLDENFIRIRTQKTHEEVVIPVHWVIKEIIERGFDFSLKTSDQKLNKNIKEVCKYAKINQEVVTSRTEGGKRVEKRFPKYKLVTSHTARRSGATNMYKAGIPSISIMKITGHRTEKSFLKYIRISQEENAEILAQHPFFQKEKPEH
jgi:integrase